MTKSPMNIRTAVAILAWLPVLLWMAAIFIMSSFPGVEVERRASRIEELVPVAGKAVVHPATFHVAVYALLAAFTFVWARFQKGPVLSSGLTAVVVTIVYGGTDELHQAFVPGRSCSAADVGYDAMGALLGVLACWLAVRAAAWRARAKNTPH